MSGISGISRNLKILKQFKKILRNNSCSFFNVIFILGKLLLSLLLLLLLSLSRRKRKKYSNVKSIVQNDNN